MSCKVESERLLSRMTQLHFQMILSAFSFDFDGPLGVHIGMLPSLPYSG